MDIIEAVNQRKSIRAFKADPIPQEILTDILENAVRAPSWANTQPWGFAVVTGTDLREIKKGFIAKKPGESDTDVPWPGEFPEPFNTRRKNGGAGLLEILGIDREDTEKRDQWRQESMKLFGAPFAIYILVNRAFFYQPNGMNVWASYDCGLVAQNIMLLATSYGLGTIPLANAVWHSSVIRKILQIPDSSLIVVGICIGYPDWEAPVNQFRSAREPIDKTVGWYGFG